MQMIGAKLEAMITRILGVILAALAAQFVIDGLKAKLSRARLERGRLRLTTFHIR